MLKFILFTIIFIYVAYKVSGFILKVFDTLLGRAGRQSQTRQGHFGTYQQRPPRPRYRQPTDGNVNIEYIPEEETKETNTKTFKGGEYVDYEEISDKDRRSGLS